MMRIFVRSLLLSFVSSYIPHTNNGHTTKQCQSNPGSIPCPDRRPGQQTQHTRVSDESILLCPQNHDKLDLSASQCQAREDTTFLNIDKQPVSVLSSAGSLRLVYLLP